MIDIASIRVAPKEQFEIHDAISSWAHAHLWLMSIDDSRMILKTLKVAIEEGKSRDMVQRLLHRYSSIHRRELAVQVSKMTGMDIT